MALCHLKVNESHKQMKCLGGGGWSGIASIGSFRAFTDQTASEHGMFSMFLIVSGGFILALI